MATLGGIAFTAILVVAAVGDLRTRRIPNRLVAVLALLGIVFSTAMAPLLHGALNAGEGILVGLVCWLPFYAFGWIGAGDVKLYAAAGAWLGPAGALEGALIAALAGAILSLLWMLKAHGVKKTADTLGLAAASPGMLSPGSGSGKRSTLPYGVALAFGAICAGWAPRILLG
jgi:prepilin peptidase CpaA